MPLFERGYKAAAKTELERATREIEEKDKKAQTNTEFEKETDALNSNLNFAERLNLISSEQANEYRKRVEKAMLNFHRMQRMENEDIVDGFENPRETSARYMGMEEVQARIARERADASAEQAQNEQAHSAPSQSSDEPQRAK